MKYCKVVADFFPNNTGQKEGTMWGAVIAWTGFGLLDLAVLIFIIKKVGGREERWMSEE